MSYHVYITASGDDRIMCFSMDVQSGALEFAAETAVAGRPAPVALDLARRVMHVGRRSAWRDYRSRQTGRKRVDDHDPGRVTGTVRVVADGERVDELILAWDCRGAVNLFGPDQVDLTDDSDVGRAVVIGRIRVVVGRRYGGRVRYRSGCRGSNGNVERESLRL